MQDLVRQAMREGALGFSTSQLAIHVGEDGREVPCNHAGREEILALRRCRKLDRGALEFIPPSFAGGYDDGDRGCSCWRCTASPGRADRAEPPDPDAGPFADDGWHAYDRGRDVVDWYSPQPQPQASEGTG